MTTGGDAVAERLAGEGLEMRFHHLGIAVPQASGFERTLGILGYEPAGVGTVERFRCRCAFFRSRGHLIEIISPLPGAGAIREFAEKRGTALHHIAYEVTDLMGSIRLATRRGIAFQSGIDRGALPGMYVTFSSPKSTEDILIEFVEFRAGAV